MDVSYLKLMDPVKGHLGASVILLVSAIYANVKIFGDKSIYPQDNSGKLLKAPDPIFDFIIVGSSTPGCILSNRLSENPNSKVLLIEAGDYPSATSDVPYFHLLLEDSDEDWRFHTMLGKYGCLGRLGDGCMISVGKVLGGCSTINDMHYYRGTKRDYDNVGIDSWSYNEARGYFNNLECFIGKKEVPFEVGTYGNITLTYFKENHFLRLPLSKMYRVGGYRPVPEGKYLGFRDMLVTSADGVRINMAKVFLSPIKERPNFTLSLKTTGTRLVFHDNKTVKGIEVIINNKYVKYIGVRKEILLTGGAINNAKLLHLSGIGPEHRMKEYGIPLIADLPVGLNFQAHLRVPMFVAIDKCCGQCLNCSQPDCQNDFFNYKMFYQAIWDYVMDRFGIFTNIAINDFAAYISTHATKREFPNVAIFHYYFQRNSFYLEKFLRNRQFNPIVVRSVLKHNSQRNLMIFYPTLLKPFSRGEVILNSSYFLGNPKVVPNFLTDEHHVDFNSLYSAITMIVSLIDSIQMQRYKTKFLQIDLPNCRNLKFCSEKYFKCYISNLACPTRTIGGTTKMGNPLKNDTVVSENLEVKHVKGVRVGDCSVVPRICTSNMISNDALIGEKLADILRTKWEKGYLSPYRLKGTSQNPMKTKPVARKITSKVSN